MTCRFYDFQNCARCDRENPELKKKCKDEGIRYYFSENYAKLWNKLNPYPWAKEELEVQNEDNWNVSDKYASFVRKFDRAELKLGIAPAFIKEKAYQIIKRNIENGNTPCHSYICAYTVLWKEQRW